MSGRSGYLTKAPEQKGIGSLGLGWKKRWFEYSAGEKRLSWFLAEKQKPTQEEISSLDLRDVRKIERSARFQKDGCWGFELTTPQRVFVLIAESERDMVAWIEALKGSYGGGPGAGSADGKAGSGGPFSGAAAGKPASLQAGPTSGPVATAATSSSSSAAPAAAKADPLDSVQADIYDAEGLLKDWVKKTMAAHRGAVICLKNATNVPMVRARMQLEGHSQSWGSVPPERIEPGQAVTFGSLSQLGTTAALEYDFEGAGGSALFSWTNPYNQMKERLGADVDRKAETSTTTMEYATKFRLSSMATTKSAIAFGRDVLVVDFVAYSLRLAGATEISSPLIRPLVVVAQQEVLEATWKRQMYEKRRTFLITFVNRSERFRLERTVCECRGDWACAPPETIPSGGRTVEWASTANTKAAGHVSYRLVEEGKEASSAPGAVSFLMIQWSVDLVGSRSAQTMLSSDSGRELMAVEAGVEVVQIGECTVERRPTFEHAAVTYELIDQGSVASKPAQHQGHKHEPVAPPQVVGLARDHSEGFRRVRSTVVEKHAARVDLVTNRLQMIRFEIGAWDRSSSGSKGSGLFRSISSTLGIGADVDVYVPKCVTLQPKAQAVGCRCCGESYEKVNRKSLQNCGLCGFVCSATCVRKMPVYAATGDRAGEPADIFCCTLCDEAIAFQSFHNDLVELRETAKDHPLVVMHDRLKVLVLDLKRARTAVLLKQGDTDLAAARCRDCVKDFRFALTKLSDYRPMDKREEKFIANLRAALGEAAQNSNEGADGDDKE